jgi:hypothetical protein
MRSREIPLLNTGTMIAVGNPKDVRRKSSAAHFRLQQA